MRSLIAIIALTLLFVASPSYAANWTLLIYMNGNNNLEEDVNFNFKQMARVDSTKDVNVVIQAARLSTKRVLRGRVQQGVQLNVGGGFEDLGDVDMGAAESLAKFLQWGIKTYPASNYAVIIWNHGQGWRAAMPADPKITHISTPNPYRAISYDDLHASKLYNKDVQTVLETAMARSPSDGGLGGRKFDIVAFDACLMAMLETSYAFRQAASLMVASEELVPGHGLPYDKILGELAGTPSMSPTELSRVFVQAFGKFYAVGMQEADPATTMAAIDVQRSVGIAQALNTLSTELINVMQDQRDNILTARQQCPVYGPDSEHDGKNYFFHVDLGCIVSSIKDRVGKPVVQAAAQATLEQLAKTVLFNSVGDARRSFGSNGLAIYFPQTLDQYRNDSYAENGYDKNNKVAPVDFVRDNKWADFVNAVLKVPARPK